MGVPSTDSRPATQPTTRRRSGAPERCAWCGTELPRQEGIGRRRQYCGQSCRQRAYEQRHAANRSGVPTDAVVLTNDQASDLADRLYQVRCAAEDVTTALAEGAEPGELSDLVALVLAAAKDAERLR